MDDIDAAIIETALRKMLADNHFSICTLDNIIKMTGVKPDPEAYKRLHVLHCVHFNAMPPTVIEALPDLIRRVLNGPTLDIDSIFRGPALRGRVVDVAPEPVKRAGLLSLFK